MVSGRIIKKIEFILRKLFKRELGDNSRKFLKNLSLSFSGGLIVFAILFIANILAARLLGPIEYGKYSFFASIAIAISTFLVLDVDSGISYFLSKSENKKQKNIISSVFLLFFVLVSIFVILSVVFKDSILVFLNTFSESSEYSILLIMGLVIVFTFKRLMDSFFRGKEDFASQFIIKVIEAFSVMIVFLSVYRALGMTGYFDYFQVVFWSSTASVLVAIFILRKNISFSFTNLNQIGKIYKYSRWGFINSFSTITLKNIDKLLIVAFFDIQAVGIYAAYYTASILPVARLNQLFINVYFPSVSSGVNKKDLYKKIRKTFLISAFPLFFTSLFFIYILILLFGSEYPVEYMWIFILGVYSVTHLFASVYSWTLAGFSDDGFSDLNRGTLLGIVAFIVLIGGAIAIGKFSILFLIISLTVNRFVVGAYSLKKLKSNIKRLD